MAAIHGPATAGAEARPPIAGVDGCKGGWIVVRAWQRPGGRLRLDDILVCPDFFAVVQLTLGCAAVAVDIPIGLSDDGPRAADALARRYLGPGRASSVFPAPVRPALQATGYRSACSLSFEACGRMLSRQAFGILDKVRQADAALTPADQARVVESHPEVVFKTLNGGASLESPKRTLPGAAQRIRLLESVFDSSPRSWSRPRGAAGDDLLDAAVLCWTAARLARGKVRRFPEIPDYDRRGLRMEIVA